MALSAAATDSAIVLRRLRGIRRNRRGKKGNRKLNSMRSDAWAATSSTGPLAWSTGLGGSEAHTSRTCSRALDLMKAHDLDYEDSVHLAAAMRIGAKENGVE